MRYEQTFFVSDMISLIKADSQIYFNFLIYFSSFLIFLIAQNWILVGVTVFFCASLQFFINLGFATLAKNGKYMKNLVSVLRCTYLLTFLTYFHKILFNLTC